MHTENKADERPKEYSVITRLDQELFERLENSRFRDRRTRSGAVRMAIKEYCKKVDSRD